MYEDSMHIGKLDDCINLEYGRNIIVYMQVTGNGFKLINHVVVQCVT